MEQTTVYVAVLRDRQSGNHVEVFTKAISALKQITEWQHGYGDRYEWHEEEIEAWEYYVRADIDDGPSMRIEAKPLR